MCWINSEQTKNSTIHGRHLEYADSGGSVYPGLGTDSTTDGVQGGCAMSVLVGRIRDDAFLNPEGHMTLTFPRQVGPPGARILSCGERWELRQKMPIDSVLMKDHPTLRKLARARGKVGVATCNRLHMPHWSMCAEVCGKTLQTRTLRIHGHLWVSLKRQTVLLEPFKLPRDAFCVSVTWNAIQFLEGASTRGSQSGYSGIVYTTIKKIGAMLRSRPYNRARIITSVTSG